MLRNLGLYNLLDSLEFYKKVCVKSKTEIFEQCEQLWQLDNWEVVVACAYSLKKCYEPKDFSVCILSGSMDKIG